MINDLPARRSRSSAGKRIGFLIFGLASALLFVPVPLTAQTKTDDAAELAGVQAVSKAFRRVAKIAGPGVVSIQAEGAAMDSDERKEFVEEFMERYGEGLDPKAREQLRLRMENDERAPFVPPGMGSGFVFDEQGYIATNNHVIKGRTDIRVVLADEREFPAKVVGADPKTDVAVLKIDAPNLTALKFGDSDALEVGDWVIAVGAPFGLSHTVTHGIVSAKGRKQIGGVRIDYQDFIQTDAAINPGNSGGPLLNLNGEVVGINTAIATQGDAYNAGIAFTIPSNMASKITRQLQTTGNVARGWLGVSFEPATDRDKSIFGLNDTKGVVIVGVLDDSPAQKAGILIDDAIISLNNRKFATTDDLRAMIADLAPNETATLQIIRGRAQRDISVKLGLQPEQTRMNVDRGLDIPALGMISAETWRPGNRPVPFDDDVRGVLVRRVLSEGPIRGDQIQLPAILVSVDDKPVATLSDLLAMLKTASTDEKLKLEFLVQSGDRIIQRVTPRRP